MLRRNTLETEVVILNFCTILKTVFVSREIYYAHELPFSSDLSIAAEGLSHLLEQLSRPLQIPSSHTLHPVETPVSRASLRLPFRNHRLTYWKDPSPWLSLILPDPPPSPCFVYLTSRSCENQGYMGTRSVVLYCRQISGILVSICGMTLGKLHIVCALVS